MAWLRESALVAASSVLMQLCCFFVFFLEVEGRRQFGETDHPPRNPPPLHK